MSGATRPLIHPPLRSVRGMPVDSCSQLHQPSTLFQAHPSHLFACNFVYWDQAVSECISLEGKSMSKQTRVSHRYTTFCPQTNGVHMPSWDSAEADNLWTNICGKERWLGTTGSLERNIRCVSDVSLWQFRMAASQSLVEYPGSCWKVVSSSLFERRQSVGSFHILSKTSTPSRCSSSASAMKLSCRLHFSFLCLSGSNKVCRS
jgi:hypothetical protein